MHYIFYNEQAKIPALPQRYKIIICHVYKAYLVLNNILFIIKKIERNFATTFENNIKRNVLYESTVYFNASSSIIFVDLIID